MLLLSGGNDIRDLFQHVGYVTKDDDYKTSIDKILKPPLLKFLFANPLDFASMSSNPILVAM